MKKMFTKCVAGVLASTLILTGCSAPVASVSDNSITASSVEQESVKKSDIISERTVKVAVERGSLYGDNVVVSSSFSKFEASTGSLLKGSSDSLTINSLSPQLVTMSKEGSDIPLAMSVVANPERATTVLISPQTTAEAMVFMHPALATVELKLADKIMSLIKSQPETKALSTFLETRLAKDASILSDDNAQQDQLMQKAVNAVVNKLADQYEKNAKAEEPANRVQGVEINVLERTELTAKVEMKNYKKRSATLNFLLQNDRALFSENLMSSYDLIDLDNISFGGKPFVLQRNYDVQLPLKKVEVIGVGLKDFKEFKERWDGMPQAEKMKYGVPLVQGLIGDFVSPIVSMVVGFNVNKVYRVGLMRLVTGLPILEIVTHFRNKDYGKAFKSVLTGTINQLLARNGALLREILLKAGVSLTEAMIKRMTAVIGIFNLARQAIEVARA
ncbi:MAG: hypothetical protein ACK4IX_13415, partial [Candidatus Sericytochromatia bacterium]